jgi:hypothetical protein
VVYPVEVLANVRRIAKTKQRLSRKLLKVAIYVVPKAGLEPARPEGLWILSFVTPLSDNIINCQLSVFPMV